MRRRYFLLPGLVLVALALMVGERWDPRAERRVVARQLEHLKGNLQQLSSSGSDARVPEETRRLVDRDATVRIADFALTARGPEAIFEYLRKNQLKEARLEMESPEIVFDQGGNQARVLVDVQASARQGGASRLDTRRVALRYENRTGDWILVDLEVLPRIREYPEARP